MLERVADGLLDDPVKVDFHGFLKLETLNRGHSAGDSGEQLGADREFLQREDQAASFQLHRVEGSGEIAGGIDDFCETCLQPSSFLCARVRLGAEMAQKQAHEDGHADELLAEVVVQVLADPGLCAFADVQDFLLESSPFGKLALEFPHGHFDNVGALIH